MEEIVPQHEFYSYEAKYLDEKGVILEVPARVDREMMKRVQELTIKTFKTLSCDGLAWVDFFLKKDGSCS